MMETRGTEGAKIERDAENQEREQLRRLWMMIFVKNAAENYPGFEISDILHEDDEGIVRTILDKYSQNPEEFKSFFRAKGRFEFAVHKEAYGKKPDFDGQMALWFFEKAGINTAKTELVETDNEPVKDKINIELGKTFGIKIPKGWTGQDKTVIVDHHLLGLREEQIAAGLQPEEEELITKISVAQMVHEGLESLGLYEDLPVEQQQALEKMAQFVSQMDNKNYPGQHQEDVFKKSDRMILGLYKNIPPDKLFTFFETGGTPTDILDEATLGKLGLIYKKSGGKGAGEIVNLSARRKQMIEKGLAMVEKAAADGFAIDFKWGEKTLKFLVDYIPQDAPEEEKSGIPLRVDAALASGYDGIVLYNEKTQSYFVNLHPDSEKLLEVKLPQGVNVRDKMIIKNAADKNPLQISLRDLIRDLGGDILKILKAKDGLAKAIEKNEQWMKSDRTVVSEKQPEQTSTVTETTKERESVENQEKWVDASEIKWFPNKEKPERNHWGISSDPEKGKKHVIIQGFPADFDPQKLLPGSKVLLKFSKDIPGIIFVKMVRIEEPKQQNKQKPEAKKETPEAQTGKYENVKLSFDSDSMEWTAILPDGQKAAMSDEIKKQSPVFDVRYLYNVKIEVVKGKPMIAKIEKTDQQTAVESTKPQASQDDPKDEDESGDGGGGGNPRDRTDWRHSKE